MYTLGKSSRKEKKWSIILPDNKVIHFGSSAHSDYTIHKDSDRRNRYLARHKKKENWREDGMDTAGFWSRWLLWNEDSLPKSIKSTERKFGIQIIF